MKKLLTRLFNHEELSREEAKQLLLDIVDGKFNNTQIASLLTVFQMRGIKVDEILGLRDALLTTRVPVNLDEYKPIEDENVSLAEKLTGQMKNIRGH